ncbi:hypothetical protein T09_15435 [Trichinella sp. T9]|nr:hypothetical protein T09_15435 [Trichinella sp. T9]
MNIVESDEVMAFENFSVADMAPDEVSNAFLTSVQSYKNLINLYQNKNAANAVLIKAVCNL